MDVSHEKCRDAIFEILAGKEYEMIDLLDLSAGKTESFRLSDTLPESYGWIFRKVGEVRDFLKLRENGIKTWVAPEDRRKYFGSTEPSVIKRSLDRDGRYELTVTGQLSERGTVYRKLQHYYLDDEKREVLIVDSGVTQLYLEQQREMECKQQARLEQTLVDTVNSPPASSALYRTRDDRTIIPDRHPMSSVAWAATPSKMVYIGAMRTEVCIPTMCVK